MIDKQIDSRRTRHIKLITEFDNWKERMYTTIAKNYQDIKIEGEDYLQKKEREIKNYWNNIKDSTLLEREKDIIDEIKTYVENCKNDISQRVSELDVRLQSMEEERERIFHLYLDRLEANINDVAF